MSDVLVRRARRDDAEAIGGIHHGGVAAAFANLVPAERFERQALDARRDTWAGAIGSPWPRHAVLVAELDGRVVGFTSAGPTRDSDDDADWVGEVRTIFVEPSLRGQGIGTSLLAEAARFLRRRGFSSATLWMVPENDRARRFYEAAGWRPDSAERRDDVHGIRVRVVRYRLEL